ncbi:Uncharacterised protein [Mycobacteroides abscessus subsp. abscessus]|nr:Uncharacterised protein [Mycobacteroides abscessus subsp. abscessus]
MADFLEKHREFDRMGQFGEAIHLPGEVGIASGLHGLLQGVGVHRQRVGTHPPYQGVELSGRGYVAQLCEPDIADEQDVGSDLTYRESIGAVRFHQHHPLRTEHHADAELLGGRGQVSVDGGRELRAAGHGTDEHRSSQPPAQELGGQVDAGETRVG